MILAQSKESVKQFALQHIFVEQSNLKAKYQFFFQVSGKLTCYEPYKMIQVSYQKGDSICLNPDKISRTPPF